MPRSRLRELAHTAACSPRGLLGLSHDQPAVPPNAVVSRAWRSLYLWPGCQYLSKMLSWFQRSTGSAAHAGSRDAGPWLSAGCGDAAAAAIKRLVRDAGAHSGLGAARLMRSRSPDAKLAESRHETVVFIYSCFSCKSTQNQRIVQRA